MSDLFPEVVADPVAMARRRVWARHQHNRIPDPEDNERYTLSTTVAECLRLADVEHIDIDLAGCPEAHCAEQWLGTQPGGAFIDALQVSWAPANPKRKALRVGWLNPPYSMLTEFTERAAMAMLDGELDVLLYLPPGDRCEQPWWQQWIEPHRDGRKCLEGMVRITTHCLSGRQTFGKPGDRAGLGATSAPFPSVLVVWSFR